MKVAILHYHFKRGGVTKVVENTTEGFRLYAPNVDFLCFSGEEYAGDVDLQHHTIPELAYGNSLHSGSTVLAKIIEKCKATWGSAPDIFHIHNHSLGKNLVVSSLLFQIANQQIPTVLHTHDFAEDARPKNYILSKQSLQLDNSVLYPISGYIHYATLNQRDAKRLTQAGIPADQVSVLANPHDVHPFPSSISKHKILDTDHLTVFPVRGIRRKNIGEIAFWSALAEKDHHYAITLTPENPQEKYFFDRWKHFCEEKQLPAYLGLAQMVDYSFDEVIASADRVITTSIAEGFGLSFLEPWGYQKALVGRSIPGISDDFQDQGIQLDHLYSEIQIPLSWLDREQLQKKFTRAIRQSWEAYDREISDQQINEIWKTITTEQSIDLGRLDEDSQEQVVTHLLEHPQSKEELSLPEITQAIPQETIQHNYQIIKKSFNLESYISQLHSIYSKIVSSSDESFQALPPENILTKFLHLEDISLLRQ